ncbi:MAG: cupin-like domain-containing protein [Sphingorhabdus sp.]
MADTEPDIFGGSPRIEERTVDNPADLDALLAGARAPFVIRGLAADWPLVKAGKESFKAARDYIASHARNMPFTVSIAEPGNDGRLFYNTAMGMNFRMERAKLPEIFEAIEAQEGSADAQTIYLGSVDLHDYFDGLHEANHVDLGSRKPLCSIWIGGPTRIAAHNDVPDNLACCAVGQRRFIVFPPEQFGNLYLGPLDNTPAGPTVSMVDFRTPDFVAHPRFKEAMAHAQIADLEAGDAIFVPSMWWHHVEATSAFNVLVNYWWRNVPAWMGQPHDALFHAILSIRDLPQADKALWRALFDHYVFENGVEVADHIPPEGRGILAPLTAESAGRLRAFLLRALNR